MYVDNVSSGMTQVADQETPYSLWEIPISMHNDGAGHQTRGTEIG